MEIDNRKKKYNTSIGHWLTSSGVRIYERTKRSIPIYRQQNGFSGEDLETANGGEPYGNNGQEQQQG